MFCAFVVACAGFSVQGAAVKRAVEALMYFQSKLYGASSEFWRVGVLLMMVP